MAETIHVRGEGGGIFPMELPLHPAIQQRCDQGALTRVNEDGTPWTEPAPAKAPARKTAAAKQ
jgi:hypothetical protein